MTASLTFTVAATLASILGRPSGALPVAPETSSPFNPQEACLGAKYLHRPAPTVVRSLGLPRTSTAAVGRPHGQSTEMQQQALRSLPVSDPTPAFPSRSGPLSSSGLYDTPAPFWALQPLDSGSQERARSGDSGVSDCTADSNSGYPRSSEPVHAPRAHGLGFEQPVPGWQRAPQSGYYPYGPTHAMQMATPYPHVPSGWTTASPWPAKQVMLDPWRQAQLGGGQSFPGQQGPVPFGYYNPAAPAAAAAWMAGTGSSGWLPNMGAYMSTSPHPNAWMASPGAGAWFVPHFQPQPSPPVSSTQFDGRLSANPYSNSAPTSKA